jgi:hypothetical protein
LIFLWGYINTLIVVGGWGGGGRMFKAGRKFLVYPESTFPSGEIFPSQKGQPIKFSKTPHHFIFLLSSHDERKLGEKINFTLEELVRGGHLFWEMPHTPRALLALLFHSIALLGWAGCTFYIVFFPSGYNCSYKLSLTCMNE